MFNAFGTSGLELFTWVVSFLVAFGGAITVPHFLKVMEEDKAEESEEEHSESQEEAPHV